jgi:hypothetical protein
MIIPLIPIRKDATEQERIEAHKAYCLELVSLFPRAFLPLGIKRRWYHFFKQEHPLTKFEPILPDSDLMIPMPPTKAPKNNE